MRRKSHVVWKGVVAGGIAGLAPAWTMNQSQRLWSKLLPASADGGQQSSEDSEDATMKTANAIAERVLHHPLSKEQKQKFGPVVHYGFGAAMGALYGGTAEISRPARHAGSGAALGTALFLGADELAVPVLHLSGAPTKYPAKAHIKALLAHLVYGLSTELGYRGVRAALNQV